MIDEEKQQENASNPMTETPEVPETTNSPEPMPTPEDDWAMQVAQAYQAADEEARTEDFPEGSAAPSSSDQARLAEANAYLQAELQATKAQLEDITGQYRRLAADFDNFRKRTQKEKEELNLNVKCSTLKELLPVIDNFERARSHLKPQSEGEMTIHKSYQSVYKQMVDCLKQLGVSPMRPEGQPFDPNFHEAVMREPTDQYEEGIITEELVRGYVLGDRILRHSMVKVAAPPEPGATYERAEETPPESAEE